MQVTARERDEKGFRPLPLRWRIEATFGTLAHRWHRLTRNLEQSPAAAEDGVMIANCHRLLHAYHRPEYFATSSNKLLYYLSRVRLQERQAITFPIKQE